MNEAMMKTLQQIENINKYMETIFLKSQMENLELKLK